MLPRSRMVSLRKKPNKHPHLHGHRDSVLFVVVGVRIQLFLFSTRYYKFILEFPHMPMEHSTLFREDVSKWNSNSMWNFSKAWEDAFFGWKRFFDRIVQNGRIDYNSWRYFAKQTASMAPGMADLMDLIRGSNKGDMRPDVRNLNAAPNEERIKEMADVIDRALIDPFGSYGCNMPLDVRTTYVTQTPN